MQNSTDNQQRAPGARAGRMRLAGALVVVAAAVAAVVVVRQAAEDRALAQMPAMTYAERSGDLVYSFHALTSTEALFDLSTDPACLHNLARSRPDEVAPLRAAMRERLGGYDLGIEEYASPHHVPDSREPSGARDR